MAHSRGVKATIFGIAAFVLVCAAWVAPVLAQGVGVSIGVGDTTFTVQGYTSPGAHVTLIDSGSVIGSVTADSTGSYSQQFTAQAPGLHNLQLYSSDRAGRTSGTANLQINVVEHDETTVDVFLSPTIQFEAMSVSRGAPLKLVGEGTPGAIVIMYVDGGTFVTAEIDSNGYWQHQLSTATLSSGQHNLVIMAQQPNGSQSYPTAPRTFVVSAEGASVSTQPRVIGAPRVVKVPIIFQPSTNTVTTDGAVIVAGEAEPGATVEVWDNGRIVGAVFADSQGKWQLSIPLFDSVNNINARACVSGVCSGFSTVVTVLLQGQFAERLELYLKRYAYWVQATGIMTLQASLLGGQSPYELTVDWGDGKRNTYTSSEQSQNLRHQYDEPGRYNGTITVTDQKGETTKRSFTVLVSGAVDLWVYILNLLLLIILVCLILIGLRDRKRGET